MPQCTQGIVEPFTTTADYINVYERLDAFVDGETCMGAVVVKMNNIGAKVLRMINIVANVQHVCCVRSV